MRFLPQNPVAQNFSVGMTYVIIYGKGRMPEIRGAKCPLSQASALSIPHHISVIPMPPCGRGIF